jgi:hypothetical protein
VKKALRRRYGKSKLPTYYRYYIRVGGNLLRREDGSKEFFSTPGAARARAQRLGGKVVTYVHDRRPK